MKLSKNDKIRLARNWGKLNNTVDDRSYSYDEGASWMETDN